MMTSTCNEKSPRFVKTKKKKKKKKRLLWLISVHSFSMYGIRDGLPPALTNNNCDQLKNVTKDLSRHGEGEVPHLTLARVNASTLYHIIHNNSLSYAST